MFEVSFIQPSQRVNLKKLVATDKKTGKGSLGKKFHLEEIYKNPELYTAYPRLKDIEIFFEDFDNPNIGGETETEGLNGIEIRLNYDLINLEPKEMKKTLVHEIQHVIQSYEDFATGGTAPAIKKQLRDNIKEAKKTLRTIPKGTSRYERIQKSIEELQNTATNTLNTFEEKYNLYWRLGGEQEAREVENRLYARDKLSPVIHTPDALIVFGGQEYSMASMAPPENKKATPVEIDESVPFTNLREAREIFKQEMLTLKNIPIVNKATGIVAQVGKPGRSKPLSDVAINKSLINGYSVEQHFSAAMNIKKLYENAWLAEESTDKNNEANVISLKRFHCETIVGGEKAIARITAKEIMEYGHRLYTIELQELNKPAELENRTGGNSSAGSKGSTMHHIAGSHSSEEPSAGNIPQTKFAGNGDLERMFAAAKPIADKQIQFK